MNTSNTNCPSMPVELVEKIISETWMSPLSVDERIHFMTASLLVSKPWMALFVRISFKHVHIPCVSYLDHFMRVLREESPIYDEETCSLPDYLCETITIQIAAVTGHLHVDEEEPPMGKVLSDILYTLSCIPYLPNLRKFSIEYQDMGYDDIFDCYRFISFPSQITDLEVKFTFGNSASSEMSDALRQKHHRMTCPSSWTLPSIRRLAFFGASDAFVADMVSCCPNVETYFSII